MSTIDTNPGTRAQEQRGRVAKIRNRVAGGLVTAAALVTVPSAAFAATGDDTSTQVAAGFSDMSNFMTTVVVGAVIALALIGTLVGLGIKWMKKGASKA